MRTFVRIYDRDLMYYNLRSETLNDAFSAVDFQV
jgi:hypothetical protein